MLHYYYYYYYYYYYHYYYHYTHTHTHTHTQSIPDNPKNNPNELTSIRMSAVVVFLAGVGQLLSWTVAWLQKSVVMSS